jgi:hypothetical protein
MKILYVVSRPLEINTSSSIRNRASIEGLLALGHNIDLITTEYDINQPNLDERMFHKALNVKYLKLGGLQHYAKYYRRYKLFKPVYELASMILSRFKIYDNLKGIADYASTCNVTDCMYDIIISSSDPKSSHLFVAKMFENACLKNTPWIQIWGDPFLTDISKSNRLLKSIIKKEEKRLLKYASRVIYVSSLTLLEQKELYPQYAMKMHYEPIPYIRKEIYPVVDEPKETLSFLYCGDYFSNVRDIKPLYETMKALNHNLTISGRSDLRLESIENIKIFPRVGFEKTKELEKECDVLVHLSNLKGSQIPGKIYQYSGTNKLILFILDGEEEALINTFKSYDRYIFCHNNLHDIKAAILQICNGIYDDTKFVVEDFEPKKIASRIIKM